MAEAKPPPTLLCEEVFDENSLPSEDEIRDYAVRIGIEPEKEPHLLSLAKDGLMKALPSGWTPCFDQRKQAWYYFNYENGTSQWEHPLDGVYRDLVRKTRQESLSSDISSIRDDLKSLDDNSGLSGALLRRATNQLVSTKSNLESNSVLNYKIPQAPMKHLPSKLDPILMKDGSHLLAPNLKMTPRPPPSPTPGSTEEAALSNNTVQDSSVLSKGWTELKISGGGSSFLKKVIPLPSTDSSSSDGAEDKAVTIVKSSLEPTRGILRDKSPQRLQGSGSFEQKSDGEEEKKSVRFNLEEGAGVQIRLFEEEDSEDKDVSVDKKPEEKVKIVVQAPDFDIMTELDEDDDDVWISDEDEKLRIEDQNKNKTSVVTSETDNGNELTNQNTEAEQQKIKNEMNERMSRMRESLEKEEMEASKKLQEVKEAKVRQMEMKMESELKNRERNIREGAERTLEKLRDELASTMEKQLSAIKVEKQIAIDLEKAEIKKHRETLAANLSKLKEDLDAEYEAKMCEERAVLEREHMEKIQRIQHQIKSLHSKEDNQLEDQLLEQRRQKQAHLEKELQTKEEDLVSRLQDQFEVRLKEKKSELEKQLKEDLARMQREAQSEKHNKMVALKDEMDRQLESARQGLREDHTKVLDKIKTEQMINIESVRMTLQKEEEEMHVAHRAKLAALSEKLNAEYETRLKRLKDIADRKAKLLLEEDSRARGDSGTATLSRTEAEIFTNQRCEHLQRQVELLSIKLKDCRKQLEEARALRPDDRVFEKLRCEKRLLEDKYRTLKDKYVRLKSDVKQTLEKRNKKRLGVSGGGATTGSETDRSSSQRLGTKSRIKIVAPPPDNDVSSEANNNLNNNSAAVDSTQASSLKESLVLSPPPTDSSDRASPPMPLRRSRRHQSKLKSCSTPRLDTRGRHTALNPVDVLRTQLQKLEDLEDLFPASTHTDTYLRYPFSENGQVGSCELEFIRHRIHLERDSVQKAKAFLKQQRHTFANRQRELHKRQSTQPTRSPSPSSSRLHTELAKDSIIQEERELSEMEVSLHRTRSLLGEKIIRLRQLEHSLQQLSANRNKGTDATLSDLSSHSGSSGFSSNDNPNELKIGLAIKGAQCSEPNEIIRSLETLNSEIRSLWDLLQRHNAEKLPAGPPPLLVPGSESPWPALTALAEQLQQIRLQQQVGGVGNNNLSSVTVSGSAMSLAERAQGLRDWLRRTKLDSAVQINSSKN